MPLVRDQGEIVHTEMQCSVLSMAYNFTTRTGKLFMVEGDCCDMSACIEFFMRIDPLVLQIRTFSGGKKDTAYKRREDRDWRAF